MNAFIGEHKYLTNGRLPPQEDDFASTLQIGMSLGAGYTAAPAKRIFLRRVILSGALLRLATE